MTPAHDPAGERPRLIFPLAAAGWPRRACGFGPFWVLLYKNRGTNPVTIERPSPRAVLDELANLRTRVQALTELGEVFHLRRVPLFVANRSSALVPADDLEGPKRAGAHRDGLLGLDGQDVLPLGGLAVDGSVL